jgi:hypothetical protein
MAKEPGLLLLLRLHWTYDRATCHAKNEGTLTPSLNLLDFLSNRNGYLRVGFCHPIPSLGITLIIVLELILNTFLF